MWVMVGRTPYLHSWMQMHHTERVPPTDQLLADLIGSVEAARILGCHRTTVERQVDDRKLDGVRIGGRVILRRSTVQAIARNDALAKLAHLSAESVPS
jgi:excisionase family DNA binding protein